MDQRRGISKKKNAFKNVFLSYPYKPPVQVVQYCMYQVSSSTLFPQAQGGMDLAYLGPPRLDDRSSG